MAFRLRLSFKLAVLVAKLKLLALVLAAMLLHCACLCLLACLHERLHTVKRTASTLCRFTSLALASLHLHLHSLASLLFMSAIKGNTLSTHPKKEIAHCADCLKRKYDPLNLRSRLACPAHFPLKMRAKNQQIEWVNHSVWRHRSICPATPVCDKLPNLFEVRQSFGSIRLSLCVRFNSAAFNASQELLGSISCAR